MMTQLGVPQPVATQTSRRENQKSARSILCRTHAAEIRPVMQELIEV